MRFFETIAMALDTLGPSGRLLLMALLLSGALCGVARALRNHPSWTLQLYYRKAAIVALVAVPLLVMLLGLQMPVYVEQAKAYATQLPATISWVIGLAWLVGVLSLGLRESLRVYRLRGHLLTQSAGEPVALESRVQHWQRRLNVEQRVGVFALGGGQAVSVSNVIWLPQAALHWPLGQQDVLLLWQLAMVKQRGYRWLLAALFVRILYWPCPWVRTLLADFGQALSQQALPLAKAAYRGPEGWRSDMKKL